MRSTMIIIHENPKCNAKKRETINTNHSDMHESAVRYCYF